MSRHDSQSGYGLLGLRAGLKTADSKWEWSGWARNVTNRSYLVDAFGAGSTFLPDRHLDAEPRTFGINVRYPILGEMTCAVDLGNLRVHGAPATRGQYMQTVDGDRR